MNKVKRFFVIILFGLLFIIMTGCGDNESISTSEDTSNDKKVLTIGVSPLTGDLVQAIVPIMEEEGYKIEIKTFDDFVLPNTALNEGSIDLNIYQHKPYLVSYNEKNGTDMEYVFRVSLSPNGLFSEKYATMEEMPNNARIGIFQDASNQDRCLRLMEEKGYITLVKNEGLYTLLDIKENKKNIEFITMDIGQLASSINDLDAAFNARSALVKAQLDPKYVLMEEVPNEYSKQYCTGIAVRKDDVTASWLRDIYKAYKTPEAKENIEKVFGKAQIVVAEETK